MLQVLNLWFKRYFSHPQAVLLILLLLLGFGVIVIFGKMLAPVIAALIIAFLLEGATYGLVKKTKIPRLLAVSIVFAGFMALLLFMLLVLLPLLSYQLSQILQDMPKWIVQGQSLLIQLPERYPDIISVAQVNSVILKLHEGINSLAQGVLSYSLASITVVIIFLIYLILVPVMVFFFLKDKRIIFHWFTGFLPKEHGIAYQVWIEMNAQMGNYVRGKFNEIFIISSACYFAFAYMGLNYAPLIAVLVGLSVIVPYIGAAIVTIPVILVAYFQWGWGSEFLWLSAIYFIIQALDGNILVPLLFSEAVNLHPVAIIIAVLIFGGIWGFWGVFFAIPLATLIKALIGSWPKIRVEEPVEEPLSSTL